MKPNGIFFPSQVLTWPLKEPHALWIFRPAHINFKGPYIVVTTARKVHWMQVEIIVSDDENWCLI